MSAFAPIATKLLNYSSVLLLLSSGQHGGRVMSRSGRELGLGPSDVECRHFRLRISRATILRRWDR